MTSNLDEKGLRSIINEYDLFFIDVWGVLHNGINLFQNSVEVLERLEENKKNYVLLTNAPRPNQTVFEFLKKMGLDKKKAQHVYTSGQAALDQLQTMSSKKFFHVGPPRDFDLFNDFTEMKAETINNSDYILCTGLFEKFDKDLNYYKNILENHTQKEMICTNPDLIVDRGNVRELCAGSVAMVFEKMGGKVVYFGKPYAEVYNQSIDNFKKKTLAIGDNLNTDIKGANLLNYDSLLISNGIHKLEIFNKGILEVSKEYETVVNFTQSDLKW